MIDTNKIKRFWELRGNRHDKLLPSLVNFENDCNLQNLKQQIEREVVFSKIDFDKSMNILDLGAGYGQWSLRFAPMVRSVTAVDYTEGFLSSGKEEAERLAIDNVRFIKSAVEDYVPDTKYQLIFLSGILMYLDTEQGAQLVKNIVPALDDGGILFLREPVSLLQMPYVRDDRWSEAMQTTYSALYRLPGDIIELFNPLQLLEEGDFFPDGSPLNKWPETRLRYFLFKNDGVKNVA